MTAPRIDNRRFRQWLALPRRHYAEICVALMGIARRVVGARPWFNEDDRSEAISHVTLHCIERMGKYRNFQTPPEGYFVLMAQRELTKYRIKCTRHRTVELPEE